MAFLRGLRNAGRRRRLSFRAVAGVVVLLALSGCKKPDTSLQPEQMLRDSLGLGDGDRVHRVRLGSPGNVETVDPVSVRIEPGDYVEFVTTDRKVHAVSFVLDSVPPGAADFLRGSAQESSPPLVSADARFLVRFADAPAGRYPFVVAGNGADGRGDVVVGAPAK